jgi:hypothetical protein
LEAGISEADTLILVSLFFETELELDLSKREVGAGSVGDSGSHGPCEGGLNEYDDASTIMRKIELPNPRARRWVRVSVSDEVVSRSDMFGTLGQSQIRSGSDGGLIINHRWDNFGLSASSRNVIIVIGFAFSQRSSWGSSAKP